MDSVAVVESATSTLPMNVGQLYQHLATGKIVLPRFQRANVWKKRQKRALIESIRQGLPIGSLLVYESLNPSDGASYVLVDGLQRTIAIRDYITSQLNFITAKSLEGEELESVVEAVRGVAGEHSDDIPTREAIYQLIEKWIHSASSLEVSGGLDSDSFADLCNEEFAFEATDFEFKRMRKAANQLIAFIQRDADITGYPLAVVKFTGSSERLPEIFRNINSGGTPLDDFDEFATDWIDFKAEISSTSVRGVVHHKWKVAEEKGLTVEQWGPHGPTAGYTFWEYVYGLGRVLKARYPFLFGNAANDSDGTSTERVSFYLLALVHGVMPRVGEIRRLPILLSRYAQGEKTLNLDKLELAIFLACDEVEKWMKPAVGMKLNLDATDRIESLSQLSQFQALSLVARTLVGRWVPYTWEQRPTWKTDWERLKDELPRHYIYGVLQGAWSGSGDSTALAATWDSDPVTDTGTAFDPAALQPAKDYKRSVSHDEWVNVLSVWLRGEMSGAQRVYRSVSKEAKLLMRYVYADIPYDWHEGKVFQIDHLLPVARLSKIVDAGGEMGWPMSAIGNLALFPKEVNQAKGDRTVVEYFDTLTTEEQNSVRPFLEFGLVDYPMEQAAIPKVDGSDHLSRDEFEAFLVARQELLRKTILTRLGV